jgi:hypothetical protein
MTLALTSTVFAEIMEGIRIECKDLDGKKFKGKKNGKKLKDKKDGKKHKKDGKKEQRQQKKKLGFFFPFFFCFLSVSFLVCSFFFRLAFCCFNIAKLNAASSSCFNFNS